MLHYESALLVTNSCGLRDYGTGAWEGGDAECKHEGSERYYTEKTAASSAGAFSEPGEANKERLKQGRWREHGVCIHCGATRIDQQLGLEATPEQYVERMVEVFREVRRVLAPHGTVWLNLGDSYAANRSYQVSDNKHKAHDFAESNAMSVPAGLKPKDLVGIPWKVAFALQADGWYLRSDIIWAKPNPMPESVTDRPTKAHEYVFLLSKQPRYFFDQEAVRERYGDPAREWWNETRTSPGNPDRNDGGGVQSRPARGPDGRKVTTVQGANGSIQHRDGERWPNGGRNIRSVWEIATQPYPEAHFATFPEELARRCIAAGCPEQVCRVCGKARERVVERDESDYSRLKGERDWRDLQSEQAHRGADQDGRTGKNTLTERGTVPSLRAAEVMTVGFTDCGHADYRPGIVLDPFIGSGTVAHVARKLGRHAVGIDLSSEYLALAARRLQQQSLFAEAL